MSDSQPAWVFDVGYPTFERDVLERSKERPVVVDFWATWCHPCLQLGPLLERLTNEAKGEFLLAKVDVDQNQDLAMAFGIESIPAVRVFQDGKQTHSFVGLLPEPQLREFLSRIRPSAADREARQAATLEKDNPAEAIRLYRETLKENPNHQAALVGLARLLVGQAKDAEARELLARVEVGSDQAEEAEQLGNLLELHRLGGQFGSEAELQKRVKAEPRNARARYELGCALAAAARYPEALDMLLSAGEIDPKLATSDVRETMVKIFQVVGVRSPLADDYRARLTRLLY